MFLERERERYIFTDPVSYSLNVWDEGYRMLRWQCETGFWFQSSCLFHSDNIIERHCIPLTLVYWISKTS